jgi:hypothetical protein
VLGVADVVGGAVVGAVVADSIMVVRVSTTVVVGCDSVGVASTIGVVGCVSVVASTLGVVGCDSVGVASTTVDVVSAVVVVGAAVVVVLSVGGCSGAVAARTLAGSPNAVTTSATATPSRRPKPLEMVKINPLVGSVVARSHMLSTTYGRINLSHPPPVR